MKQIKKALGIAVVSLCVLTIQAQQPAKRECGTVVLGNEWHTWFNAEVAKYQAGVANQQAKAANYVIPVVVHVIHAGQNIGIGANITQAQVNSQITVLNNDFAGMGFNVNTVPSAFANLVSNTGISFCLAQLDPQGNCLFEPGIHRVDFRKISGATNPILANSTSAIMGLMDNVVKPATIWDPTRYFNIWVSEVGNGADILGYATFPTGTNLQGLFGTGGPTNDGIWVRRKSFGNTGNVEAPYDGGRTATHETGHWLGLIHVWGDAICGTDYCNDTPPAQESNSLCPTHPVRLGVCAGNTTGEMFMNFMDYCEDACLYMFTPNQNARMQTAMQMGTYRNQLNASSATLCNIPAAAPEANFSTSTNELCLDSILMVTNLSTGGPCPSSAWSISPAGTNTYVGGTSTSYGYPRIKFSTPGSYTISLTVTNASGSSSLSDVVSVIDCNNTVGLKDNRSNVDVKLYPNPANDEVYLVFDAAQKVNKLFVFNSLGELQTSLESVITDKQIILKTSHLTNGVYSVLIHTPQGNLVKRLIVGH